MKERIERYVRKKKREKALKLVKDNIFVILGALSILILLIILKVLKRKAKKEFKAKIKGAVKEKVSRMRNKDDSSDGEETKTEE